MSKHREEITLDLNVVESIGIVRRAIADLGWRVLHQAQSSITCKECTPTSISFTNSAEIEVILFSAVADSTRIILNGSVFGFGPIQSGHLRGQVGNLRNRIEFGAREQQLAVKDTNQESLASQMERLAQLHDRGILSDHEFEQAKSLLLNR